MGDESIGFDTFRHSYGSIPSTSTSVLDSRYGVNSILWNKPITINKNNIDDICWKQYYPIIHSNIFLVFEGPPKLVGHRLVLMNVPWTMNDGRLDTLLF